MAEPVRMTTERTLATVRVVAGRPAITETSVAGSTRGADVAEEAALERIALLAPGAAHAARREPLEYALAYVARYPDDVVQLEREWDFLRAALDCARSRGQHASGARIAAALAFPAGRRKRLAEGEHVLRLGIDSARRSGDRRTVGLLINRLGGLRFAGGHYWQGWRLWRAGLELVRATSGGTPGWWAPTISFATCVDVLGHFGAEREIIELIAAEDPEMLAVALFVRGFYARHHGHRDQAYDDLSAALRLYTRLPHERQAESWHVLALAMQTELARLEGDDTRARDCATAAIALARIAGDRHTLAALVIDQALNAYVRGHLDEGRALLRSLDDDGAPDSTPLPIIVRGRRFLNLYLADPASRHTQPARVHPPLAAATARVRLSEREAEVLRLIAAGYSTQAIAARMVVTPATVKKHLEHIYTKLDAHSRTAAVATARALGLLP
jgi:DNA-binding CsgD family transcriptional regulator